MKLSRMLSLVVSGTVAGMVVSGVSPAFGIIVNVGGQNYDVTTVQGTFLSTVSTLQSQPWWNNSSLANSFAAAVNTQLGFPNSSPFSGGQSGTGGPVFSYAWNQNSTTYSSFIYDNSIYQGITQFSVIYIYSPTQTYTYAISNPIPVPFDFSAGATIPTVGAFFALAHWKKARQKGNIANSTTTIS